MNSKTLITLLCLSVIIVLASMALAEKGRIYGKIHTDQGDILEGPIRWDVNESSWVDMIDCSKERRSNTKDTGKNKRKKYRDKYRDKKGGSSFSIFGINISGDNAVFNIGASDAAIPFGIIKTLTPLSGGDAEIVLRNGDEIEVSGGSTDLGNNIRDIVIETKDEGMLELDWYDIDYIEFMEGGDVESDFGERIYGTVTTDRAGEYTGWICWDVDESFTDDIIDGREKKHKRKIKFGQITSIEKSSSQASEVTTKDGKTRRLDDSNDIDSGNRGIRIADLNLGSVNVDWDEFERLDIIEAPGDAYVMYDDYVEKCNRLYGTAYDEDGDEYTGYIRWDDDEEYGWEILDGKYRDVDFDIMMANIKTIEKLSRRGTRVTLLDGRVYKLRESNDVNDENRGILIFPKGDEDDEIYLEWDEFDRIEFKKE